MTRASLVAGRLLRVPGAFRPAPALFMYPGLTSKPWHDRDAEWAKAWLSTLEAATPAITEEYLALRDAGLPSDYVVEASDHAGELHEGQSEWHWASLIDRGQPRPAMQERCPTTTSILHSIPGLCLGDMPFAVRTLEPWAP